MSSKNVKHIPAPLRACNSKAAAQAVTRALCLMAPTRTDGLSIGVGIRDAKAKERAQQLGDSLSLVSTKAYEMQSCGDG